MRLREMSSPGGSGDADADADAGDADAGNTLLDLHWHYPELAIRLAAGSPTHTHTPTRTPTHAPLCKMEEFAAAELLELRTRRSNSERFGRARPTRGPSFDSYLHAHAHAYAYAHAHARFSRNRMSLLEREHDASPPPPPSPPNPNTPPQSQSQPQPPTQPDVAMETQTLHNAPAGVARAAGVGSAEQTAKSDVTPEQRQNAINSALGVASNNASRNLKEQLISFFQPSDNKLAMKLFGNKNALLKERKRQQQSGFAFVIHPCSDFRFYWDLVMLIVLALNVVVLPVSIAFFYEDIAAGWVVFNCISDTLFMLDILCNFRTGVITNDFAEQILLDPKAIACHYLKTWFFLDIISSLPMDYMLLVINSDDNYNQLMHAGRALRILRLAKLLSLLRLLRFSRLVRYMSQWEEFLNIAAMLLRVLNLVLLILLLAHWNACLQFLIPALKEFPPDSWVALEEIEHAPWVTQYTWSMFRALSHMLCIGYGKYPPQSMADAWSTMVSMLSGAISYAMFVGHATALVQSFDTSKRMYREKWKQVEEYMAFRKLPRNLRQRISNYYEHRYQGKMFDEEAILGELSECLREQIINYNCRALVAAVPYFANADADFVSEVVTNLRFEVFQPEDIVIKAGTIGTKMYFIQEGTVEVILPNGTVATCLHDGAYFGEICLLVEGARRVATIKAVTYCNLYSLSNENFNQVLDNYPSMRQTMEQVAQERLHKIGVNSAKLAGPSADGGSRSSP